MGESVFIDYKARISDFEAKIHAMENLSAAEKKKLIADYAAITKAQLAAEKQATATAKAQVAGA